MATHALPAGFNRFAFIAEALDASGGFAPAVIYTTDSNQLSKPTGVSGPCYLVPYPRESAAKYAARAAVAVYENHLREACDKFVGYLVQKPPTREGVDGPLTSKFLDDADGNGNALDVFWANFMVEARARGTMLLLIDAPAEQPATLADQIAQRTVPYLTAIRPERVRQYTLNDHGRFTRVGVASTAEVDGKPKDVLRVWTDTTWQVLDGERVIQEGVHGFKRCPVLAFIESGTFPCIGKFEQIAQLSRRHYNAQSELDEILRSQTFSLLTYQVQPEAMATFNATEVASVVGTHNMLIHSGNAPEFIAPDNGPADVYLKRVDKLEASIRRIGFVIEDTAEQAAESGLALQLRFVALNSALSAFARRMQDLERQVWDLFSAGIQVALSVTVNWPDDYSLADLRAELDVLTLMQSTGFPDRVLIEKRKQIAAAEFANADQDTLDELMAAIDEGSAEPDPNDDPNTDPNQDPTKDDPNA